MIRGCELGTGDIRLRTDRVGNMKRPGYYLSCTLVLVYVQIFQYHSGRKHEDRLGSHIKTKNDPSISVHSVLWEGGELKL